MIHAEGVKAVQELLVDRGIELKEGERWGDYVARGLNLSETEADAFLAALDQNLSVEEALAKAQISPDRGSDGILVEAARVIGQALARVRNTAR